MYVVSTIGTYLLREVDFSIEFVLQLGMNFDLVRSESVVLHVFPFNSEKKRGGVAVKPVIDLSQVFFFFCIVFFNPLLLGWIGRVLMDIC